MLSVDSHVDLEKKYQMSLELPDERVRYINGVLLDTTKDYSDDLIPFCQFIQELYRNRVKGFEVTLHGYPILDDGLGKNTVEENLPEYIIGRIRLYTNSCRRSIPELRELFDTIYIPSTKRNFIVTLPIPSSIEDTVEDLEVSIGKNKNGTASKVKRISIALLKSDFVACNKKFTEDLINGIISDSLNQLSDKLRFLSWIKKGIVYEKDYPDLEINFSDTTLVRTIKGNMIIVDIFLEPPTEERMKIIKPNIVFSGKSFKEFKDIQIPLD